MPCLVFPTPVGVFLPLGLRPVRRPGLPHTRGGVSIHFKSRVVPRKSSPHPWGCFRYAVHPHLDLWVFPTPVGVFLSPQGHGRTLPGLPHTRGGVSRKRNPRTSMPASSPHPWGCFYPATTLNPSSTVFPTPVGVFPLCSIGRTLCRGLPHTRGGVSKDEAKILTPLRSSPHPWGCFRHVLQCRGRASVFPTPVGVFPTATSIIAVVTSLPHTRGGVSIFHELKKIPPKSSPHPWGCFYNSEEARFERLVFPTPVGVFPSTKRWPSLWPRLPHTRGGVSHHGAGRGEPVGSSPHPWGCFRGSPG